MQTIFMQDLILCKSKIDNNFVFVLPICIQSEWMLNIIYVATFRTEVINGETELLLFTYLR
jgi:hypothetical protein